MTRDTGHHSPRCRRRPLATDRRGGARGVKPALVTVDAASLLTGRAVPELFALAGGSKARARGLEWVFNFSKYRCRGRRELRFWTTELQEWPAPSARTLDAVIADILPRGGAHYHAGEVDHLFQIRPRTRIDMHNELSASVKHGSHRYRRDELAAFLKRRWLGPTKKKKARAGKRICLNLPAESRLTHGHAGVHKAGPCFPKHQPRRLRRPARLLLKAEHEPN